MLELLLATALKDSLKELYNLDIEADKSLIQKTKKEFEGDFTIVVFPYVKAARKAPDVVATEIGNKLQEKMADFVTADGVHGSLTSFNVVKGFLNFSVNSDFWLDFMSKNINNENFGRKTEIDEQPSLIEFSSPNTNKPLHLGHIRNNLLGNSVALILDACGKHPIKVNLVNDRGIHICKSMLAWLKFGHGETAETSGMKGDHLVGKYYVEFDKQYKAEMRQLQEQGMSEEEAAKKAPLMLEAQEMLRKWEQGDEEVRALWNKMNGWVYAGFEQTYQRMGIKFDKTYYESNTYILGKQLVDEGLQKGVFYRKEDNSVWVDLTAENLDEKLLLRGDGTSVYMTQDLGTAQLRYEEFHPQKMIYVVGNEQNYHFDVLKLVLGKKLGKDFGNHIYHLSYGMVELPNGKMKSREGTVVDADDLMDEMFLQAKESTEALGKHDFTPEEANKLYEMIGIGALKYFILKVDPKKNMLFNPAESIDFNGNTAPFIQYTHARIKSLMRKAEENGIVLEAATEASLLGDSEKALLKSLYAYPQVVEAAGEGYSPALIANYMFDLAKDFNSFYQASPIFKEDNAALRALRLRISQMVAMVLKRGMALLGIDVPEKM
ncbi:MAG: arginine--tRNA ligase [Bacteroidales bacterium]|nr:arginine--tRNA ligase [Bacteroidales bacterium]